MFYTTMLLFMSKVLIVSDEGSRAVVCLPATSWASTAGLAGRLGLLSCFGWPGLSGLGLACLPWLAWLSLVLSGWPGSRLASWLT